ncbi:HAMP domain-containing histidine kinase [Parvularcula sp. ZS-1/3]|uniref:histidine kinase n=1 Tax=Parvularcula mediterranea TaxID=2732508 RepID=A0A7Y3RMU3_9PROT|nr:HAMP domain-containing sensor histidine kinase [Parvularcula mediterranea]NNU16997.1 HAMP domain-containing histidine kinase [Parvularcula mediterranea]
MILRQDEQGTIVGASETAVTLFGVRGEPIRGLRLTDLVRARQHPALLSAMNEALAAGKSELAVDLREGARVASAILEIQSIPAGGFITRIRPKIASAAPKQQPRGLSKLPSEKLADVSHEIRTPLNAVIGFADALRQESFGPLGDRRYRDYARLIQESGQHVLSLINDLLDLSKVEAEKLELHLEPVDVRAFVISVAQTFGLEAERAGLELTCQTAKAVGIHTIDKKVVRQVLLNLLGNALKFTQSGSITLRTKVLGDQLVFAVEDTGVGMSRADLGRIGERFYQARSEGVRGGKGSGLGLSLSAALAKAHGGRLDLTSEEGRGTVATLSLPIKQAQPKRYRPLENNVGAEIVSLYRSARQRVS